MLQYDKYIKHTQLYLNANVECVLLKLPYLSMTNYIYPPRSSSNILNSPGSNFSKCMLSEFSIG